MVRESEQEVREAEEPGEAGMAVSGTRRRRRWRIALGLGLVGAAGLGAGWIARKDIADNLVARELSALGVRASYQIVRISPEEQVVRNVVVGDPKRPDLTIAEVRIATHLTFGWPGLGRITLVRPRLYGTVRDGKPSFGALDVLLFPKDAAKEPSGLPDLDVAIVDGRALLETDAGRIGLSLKGKGGLQGGFDGELGATARELALAGCRSGPVHLYGRIAVSQGRPRLRGPLRLEDLACPAQSVTIAKAGLKLDVTLDSTLDGGEAQLGLASEGLRLGTSRARALEGTVQATYRQGTVNARYDLAARKASEPSLAFSELTLNGTARASHQFRSVTLETDLGGRDLAVGADVTAGLQRAAVGAQGTFAASLAQKLHANLVRQLRGARFEARLIARRTDAGGRGAHGGTVVVPQVSVTSRKGERLLELSRVQMVLSDGPSGGPMQLSGNFTTGGSGLPQLEGRMETQASGQPALHARMADYRAGTDHLEIPELVVRQDRSGAFTLDGQVRLGGALPGGSVENLAVPIAARWTAPGARDGVLELGPACTNVTFDSLTFANMAIDQNRLALCPAPGRAMARIDAQGVSLAAGTAALALSGHLGASPIRLESGPIGFAWPGTLSAKDVKVALGPQEAASRFTITRLDADFEKGLEGTFDEADIALASVPLDLHHAGGRWRFADGALRLDDSHFELVDRVRPQRFNPLVARDASLRLADNVITAEALLREPASDRSVVRADIVHDLATMRGHADLDVKGLKFDKGLQPDALADTLMGVVSSLRGSVQGTGRVEWKGERISSRGRFSSEGLDFAAPFGPVKGLSGTVVFTDLLGLVTAPDQHLKVASINPGIEVDDGDISFETKPGYRLVVNGANWPFMEGRLALEPTTMTLGAVETRRYTLKVEGLDAASLIRHMGMDNISASGVFDGEVPIVYDAKGSRIEKGTLVARDPGGNVAYLGALTYEDLSAMGNFAFDALKSVDYKTMEVTLDGSLSGEIITQLRFTGISQGTGARRNFLTRQVARLPIRFVVNVKAPFFQLFGNMRSLYDSDYVADPRTLGLVGKDGTSPAAPGARAPFISIQPPVSEESK